MNKFPPLTDFQKIWILARCNNETWRFTDDDLPRNPIQWRTDSWFQRRLEEVREETK